MEQSFRIRHGALQWLLALGFVALYVGLDFISYIEPLSGLNFTPWNPDPALGLVVWMRFGRRAAAPWLLAILLSEWLVRGLPSGPMVALIASVSLTCGYGLIGEALRARFVTNAIVDTRRRLFSWLFVIVLGLFANALVYIAVLCLSSVVAPAQFGLSVMRFAVGDIVGAVVSMPLIWMLSGAEGRASLRAMLGSWDCAGYLALAVFMVWAVFYGVVASGGYRHFYLLFLPIVWAAGRHGLKGTGLAAFVMQVAIIGIVRVGDAAEVPFGELQLLGLALALVGFFIGVVVDEQRQAESELKQSLRLAAAGEMAAALAHELNQPMTALAAYGRASEHMLKRGDTGPLLVQTIGKMLHEAGRAAEVVRRLREFFRTGALQLETTNLADIMDTISAQFALQCSQHQVLLYTAALPPLSIRVDRLQIELVLRNLVANAMDAVLTQPLESRRIVVSGEALDYGRLRISVEDSGTGVSKAVLARLFEPFVSAKSSGLGLGLVLSRSIVEAHGGQLWAEAGERGLFRFILPLSESGATLES
jgi:two-component system sensor kinase FixL